MQIEDPPLLSSLKLTKEEFKQIEAECTSHYWIWPRLKPALSALIGDFVAIWARIDTAKVRVLSSLMTADFRAVSSMLSVLYGVRTKAILAVIEEVIDEPDASALSALMKGLQRIEETRNRFVHQIWVRSGILWDSLLLLESSHLAVIDAAWSGASAMWERAGDGPKGDKDWLEKVVAKMSREHKRAKLDPDKVWVYSRAELTHLVDVARKAELHLIQIADALQKSRGRIDAQVRALLPKPPQSRKHRASTRTSSKSPPQSPGKAGRGQP